MKTVTADWVAPMDRERGRKQGAPQRRRPPPVFPECPPSSQSKPLGYRKQRWALPLKTPPEIVKNRDRPPRTAVTSRMPARHPQHEFQRKAAPQTRAIFRRNPEPRLASLAPIFLDGTRTFRSRDRNRCESGGFAGTKNALPAGRVHINQPRVSSAHGQNGGNPHRIPMSKSYPAAVLCTRRIWRSLWLWPPILPKSSPL